MKKGKFYLAILKRDVGYISTEYQQVEGHIDIENMVGYRRQKYNHENKYHWTVTDINTGALICGNNPTRKAAETCFKEQFKDRVDQKRQQQDYKALKQKMDDYISEIAESEEFEKISKQAI